MSNWRRVEEFPEYLVSDTGLVYSEKAKRLLGGSIHKQGYRMVWLQKDGQEFGRLVHRLVALAFIPNPTNLPNVCHNDGDPANNHKNNLRWDNQTGNLLDTFKHGTATTANVLNPDLVRKIRELYRQDQKWGAAVRISKHLNLNYDTVKDVISGRSWSHVK